MKKNHIVLVLLMSLFINNTNAKPGLFNDLLDGAVILIAGFGAISIGAVSYGGYKGYKHMKYHFSSSQEKVRVNIEHINAEIDEINKVINSDEERTLQERDELSQIVKQLKMDKIRQARMTLKHGIKMAKE